MNPSLSNPQTSQKVLLSSYQTSELTIPVVAQLYSTLNQQGYDIFLADNNRRIAKNGLQQIYTQLSQCDRVLLLLSPLSAVSETATEEVRLAKMWQARRDSRKPALATLSLNCPFSLLNYDLRHYLQDTPWYEWRTPEDTEAIIGAILELFRDRTVIGSHPPTSTPFSHAAIPNYPPQPVAEPELPPGQVELASAFYIERSGIDDRSLAEVTKPGALIRIKAPRQMGKTSLMARLLHHAAKGGYATVSLSLQLVEGNIFTDLEQFLRWFCASVAEKVGLPERLADFWQGTFGSKVACKSYFERYLLANLTHPLVLGLDEVDVVFQYPELAADFLGLLRACHEDAKNREIWRKLRLVLVHSTEIFVPLSIHQSPFNVGLPIELPEFQPAQVLELAQRHGLTWERREVERLMAMVGGNPYLVRLALYFMARQEMTLDELLETAPTDTGAFGDRLRRHLWTLQQYPELAAAMKRVVEATAPVPLEPRQGFKLHSLGLIHLQGDRAIPRCHLYRLYYRRVMAI
jgi:serine/threonine-protein kinase